MGNGFASTLIATLVGAAIGLFGVWWGFRWQEKHRYREMLDEAIVRLLDRIADHATALQQFRSQQEDVEFWQLRGADYFRGTGERAPEMPANFAMSISLDIAQMRARGKDQEIVTEAIRAYDGVRAVTELSRRQRALGLVGGALSRWRSGIWTPQEVLASLARAATYAQPDDVDVPES